MNNATRVASADLWAAELRVMAATKNWLPGITPSLSLDGLGAMVAQIAVEQVLFDNGRRKALREVAWAELEVAAVDVSIDANNRVHDALSLLVEAAYHAKEAAVAENAVLRMSALAEVVALRSDSGYGDPGDGSSIMLRLAEMRDRQASSSRRQARALNELERLAGRHPEALSGADETIELGLVTEGLASLSVLRAAAERDRKDAEARASRAAMLPRIGLSGTMQRSDGETRSEVALLAGAEGVIGLGTRSAIAAQNARIAVAEQTLLQAKEDASRSMRRASADLLEMEASFDRMDSLIAMAHGTSSLYLAQFREGRRSIVEVVASFDTLWSLQSRKSQLWAEAERARLALGRDLGVLIDGREL
ncbi:TolC family protein [Yoonia sp.]|uniref:TolC family protein n=1 Tax=Yoonia sp. TaxID=2212373 RepID=UPI00397667C9